MSLEAISEGARWLRFIDPAGEVTHQDPCRYRFTAWNTLYANLLRPPSRRTDTGWASRFPESRRPGNGSGVHQSTALTDGRPGDLCRRDHLSLTSTPAARSRSCYSGYLGWRGVVRESELDPDVFGRLYEAITYSIPPLSHILAYPIPEPGGRGPERVLNYVWYRNLEEGPALDDVLTDVDGVRRSMSVPPGMLAARHISALKDDAEAVLPDDLARMVLTTKHPFIQTVVDVEVPRMVFGRVCLIGDAAFSARPHAAAGTAKAAADAWSLSCLAAGAVGDVVAAFRPGSRWRSSGDAGSRPAPVAWEPWPRSKEVFRRR